MAKTPSFKKNNLTIDKLKRYNGLESLTTEQATEAMQSLERISILLFRIYKNIEISKHEE